MMRDQSPAASASTGELDLPGVEEVKAEARVVPSKGSRPSAGAASRPPGSVRRGWNADGRGRGDGPSAGILRDFVREPVDVRLQPVRGEVACECRAIGERR